MQSTWRIPGNLLRAELLQRHDWLLSKRFSHNAWSKKARSGQAMLSSMTAPRNIARLWSVFQNAVLLPMSDTRSLASPLPRAQSSPIAPVSGVRRRSLSQLIDMAVSVCCWLRLRRASIFSGLVMAGAALLTPQVASRAVVRRIDRYTVPSF